MRREAVGAECLWRTVTTLSLPRTAAFVDYSALSIHHATRAVAVSTQEGSQLWVGQLAGGLAEACAFCAGPAYLGRVAKWPEAEDGGITGVAATLGAVAQLLRQTLAAEASAAAQGTPAGPVLTPDEASPAVERARRRVECSWVQVAQTCGGPFARSRSRTELLGIDRRSVSATTAYQRLLSARNGRAKELRFLVSYCASHVFPNALLVIAPQQKIPGSTPSTQDTTPYPPAAWAAAADGPLRRGGVWRPCVPRAWRGCGQAAVRWRAGAHPRHGRVCGREHAHEL